MLNRGYILDEKYEVVKTLGQGGMSTVYLCKNTRLDNLWAIKEVKKELKGQIDFLAEPNILKNLSHPGIPRVVDIFYREDNLYIVEDYIEGETLQDYIKKNGSVGPKEIRRIALDICDIIEYLHSFNPPIIYRDLKPSNIMITPKGKVVLIDFGISRIYKQGEYKDTVRMGSKGYAAPEQYGMEQTCTRTDIYGIGAVMYFMIIGKAPATLLETQKDKSYSKEVNIEFKEIIQKATQVDIENRYSSVDEMKKELLKVSEKDCDTKTLLMNNEKLTEQKPEKARNKFEIPYNKSKINKDKKKKSFKKKLIPVLICCAIILGLIYLTTEHGKTQQIINSDQVTNSDEINSKMDEDKTSSDLGESENKNNTNSVDNSKGSIKSPTLSTENKANTENSSINETANSKEDPNILDKNLQNRKESKTKSNGKAKGKHKYDESN